MIRSFGNKRAEDIYHGNNTKQARRLPVFLHENAQDKLDMLNSALQLSDLKVPPGNKLEPLKGDLRGKYSIRINDQLRIVFCWNNGNVQDVEIVDYH